MRDRIELEEVFDNEELTAREMEAIDRMERARKQVKLQASMFWFIQKRRQQADWSWKKSDKKWKKSLQLSQIVLYYSQWVREILRWITKSE